MKKTYTDVDFTILKSIPNPDTKTYEIKLKQPETKKLTNTAGGLLKDCRPRH